MMKLLTACVVAAGLTVGFAGHARADSIGTSASTVLFSTYLTGAPALTACAKDDKGNVATNTLPVCVVITGEAYEYAEVLFQAPPDFTLAFAGFNEKYPDDPFSTHALSVAGIRLTRASEDCSLIYPANCNNLLGTTWQQVTEPATDANGQPIVSRAEAQGTSLVFRANAPASHITDTFFQDVLTTGLGPDFYRLQFRYALSEDTNSGISVLGPASPVPEPMTLVLLGTGVVGLAARRRRNHTEPRPART